MVFVARLQNKHSDTVFAHFVVRDYVFYSEEKSKWSVLALGSITRTRYLFNSRGIIFNVLKIGAAKLSPQTVSVGNGQQKHDVTKCSG